MTDDVKNDGFGIFMWAVLRFFVTIIYKICYNIKFEGLENLPRDGGHIFASNHRSNADPIFLTLPVRGKWAYMAKREMFEGKSFFRKLGARFFKALGAFPVERGKGDMVALDEAVKRIHSGKNFMIFPEGHRSKDGKVQKGKSGIALIASKAETDVIPVGIVFEGKLGFRKKVVVRFGKSIPFERLRLSEPPVKAELKSLVDTIMTNIEELVYSD